MPLSGGKISPNNKGKYRIFIQSRSTNIKLPSGSGFCI